MGAATTITTVPASSERLHRKIRDIYTQGFALGEDDQPHDASWSLAPGRGQFVYEMCRKSGAATTLEVGFAFGVSTLCILAALVENGVTGTPHVAMDPFQSSERFRNAGLRTLRDAGVREMVDFHREASETFLPKLVGEGRQFDFILIDGDHAFDHTLVDIFYAHRMLKPGGTMVIDDVSMPPVYLATRYLVGNYHYEMTGEAFGSHQDVTQTWMGEAILPNQHPRGKESPRRRSRIRAYRKPIAEALDQSFWGAPFDDFMRFWVDDFHDPESLESFQRRMLNQQGLRSLAAGNKPEARRFLIAAIARDPSALRGYLRLGWTLLPKPLAIRLATGAAGKQSIEMHEKPSPHR